ncbi:hypothetical protein PCASD_04171 [Puccinia coronata f. sp. avenae]|uniref:F-box domain-containing protein n=1 Tax=Puccinia coronata f. sp. avenae TaxID=200324 RepID=A0A2N5V809_9BASI|nr:hypothetical protein PCASD_04171 [Puccinia coronata f. sp. avenae]
MRTRNTASPHKRAASEPLPSHHHSGKRRICQQQQQQQHSSLNGPASSQTTPSPPLPMSSALLARPAPSTPSTSIGCLPLHLFIYIASFVGESELIRLSCCSRPLRRALLRTRSLWTKQLTLNLARLDVADQIKTLYLERIQLPQLEPTPASPHSSAVTKWLDRLAKSKDLMLNALKIRLHAPQVSYDAIHNKYLINPEDHYWNAQLLVLNVKLVKELMHKPLLPPPTTTEPHSPLPQRLELLDIRLEGQFDQTLGAANEAWSLAQTPWAKSVKEYRLSVGHGLARIPSFSLIALSSWMPELKSFEVRIGTVASNDPNIRRQQQRQQRHVLGGTEFSEMTPGLRSAQLIPCTIERLHLEGICFSPNLLILPQQFPFLQHIVLKSVIWGRMIYELIRRSERLQICKLIDFCFAQEMEEDLPSDWNFSYWEDDMSSVGSEEGGMTLKAPPIHATQLTELHLLGEGTPHIWSVLGECIQNPIIKMPKLEKLVCESLDLEEEEQALIDLADLAPNLRQIAIRNCILRDEVDLYHCIRCLPELELLDCRLTENITSNLINALALSVPNIRHLDVRGCPYVHVTSVARLAETIRDSSDSERRIEYIGVDKPLEPNFGLESAQEDSVRWEIWQLWQAWNWLEFTHVLLDQEEWKARHRGRKDKQPVLNDPTPPLLSIHHRPQDLLHQASSQGPRIRLTCRSQQENLRPGHSHEEEEDDEDEDEDEEEEEEEEEEEDEEDDVDEDENDGQPEEHELEEEEEEEDGRDKEGDEDEEVEVEIEEEDEEEEEGESQQMQQQPRVERGPQDRAQMIPSPSHHPPGAPAGSRPGPAAAPAAADDAPAIQPPAPAPRPPPARHSPSPPASIEALPHSHPTNSTSHSTSTSASHPNSHSTSHPHPNSNSNSNHHSNTPHPAPSSSPLATGPSYPRLPGGPGGG